MSRLTSIFGFVLLLALPSGCGSDEDTEGTGGTSSGGTGGSKGGTGGSGGSSGGSGGSTGGSGGSTGGSGGSTGGSAGSASGGSAGSASGGSGGSATGGAAGAGTGGTSGGWGCTEQAGACHCSTSAPGASPTCQGAYSCCYTWSDGCDCLDLAEQQCDQTIKSLKGTKATKCPP